MAAMAVMTGTLAAEVNAEAYQYSTARVVESTASSTKRTGKQLTYKQAYNRLKDLSIFSGSSPAQTTTKPTTTAKPTQNNTSTKPNQNTQQDNCEGLPIANGTKYSPDNYKYANGSNFSDLAKVVITKKTNTSSVKNYTASSKNTSLPSGWYKYKAILIPNKKSIRQSDWTKEGNFYFIERSSGTYYIYDIGYDNYYKWISSTAKIQWYNVACHAKRKKLTSKTQKNRLKLPKSK